MIHIEDDILQLHSMGLLKKLLQDKTTKANIIWATDAHKDLGAEYERDKEIKPELITGDHSGIIKIRARKALADRSERTKKHGEVFTPLWTCKKMNDYMDELHPAKTWQKYVDARVLEITCGEAPFLCSRYDASNGEEISPQDRIGILDRKLRTVNTRTETTEDWIKWAYRALEATYGYEFQGDNLLIARINVFVTFEEQFEERLKRKMTDKECGRLVNIICWNIWQMDGLTGTIPYCKADEEHRQMSLFECMGEEAEPIKNLQPKCKVYDWRRGNSTLYKTRWHCPPPL